MLRTASSVVRLASRRLATNAEIVEQGAQAKVSSLISESVSDAHARLFAVVYVNGRQWKVGQGDLISLDGHLPLDVGDKINLDKVLMVGGSQFSVFGRPLLDPSTVSVKATVVEKSTKSPELQYFHYNHKQIKGINWLSDVTTVLRITEVTAKGSVVSSAEKQ